MERKLEIDGKPRQINNINLDSYRKKPVTVGARRIFKPFRVQTMEGIMEGKAGDWLIRGVKGEFYPCDHNIFKATYSKVDVKESPFHEVGCRKCGKGGNWKIFYDGKGHFRALHECGHKSKFEIVKKPDGLRMVT